MRVVCVESAWCNIAAQIGRGHVQTNAIITTPGIDPHEFSPTPAMARLLAQADFALMNGATYDDWATPFLTQTPVRLNVGEATGWAPGADAHLFLDPQIVRDVSQKIAARFQAVSPENAAVFSAGLAEFLSTVDQVQHRLAMMRMTHHRVVYAATETQGTALFAQAGLQLVDVRYAQAIAQHTAPSPRDEAALERALQEHKIAFLVINPTVQAPQIDHLKALAQEAGVPVIQVGETLPQGVSWQEWVMQILDQTDKALNAAHL
ncbi:metal ABC transporter solute-binding protein, Zn/Mn family [Neokomagataea anthophila]|uniref:Zinc ABC transporter substrate-binding protein n=1 Tax=Neokomagataea anthophila TaxID=2826925 RepID=A0ABS5E7I0_9PROT|nr:zinc ABC transporter substrate-binding protein [Neokomagataea anthophila]MBR0559870.1 zinc ABC transporter substrate-binding protein [Neokomagataea anthophila]